MIIGSQASHVIGQPIYFAFFDEISFVRNQDIEKQKQIAMDMIDTAIGGMKTRFLVHGHNPTLLALASSKRSDKSFLEEHMKKKLSDEDASALIVDEPVWNVRPPSTYCGKKFKVALGNKFLASEIIPDGADVENYINKGYKILDVPIEFKTDFKDDIDRALCDFAGVSSSSLTKYISGARLSEIKTKDYINAFSKDVIEVGDGKDDLVQYSDFFDMEKIDRNLMSRPLFIHLDMSISGDKTGIAGVWILGKKHSSVNESSSRELYYKLAFSVSIKAPKGHQISFAKNREFIYWLKEQGFNIRGVSTDTFQNASLAQDLLSKGYPYEIVSVDRVNPQSHICEPYAYFKNVIYEGRLQMYENILLTEEILGLERNGNTGKIDHPDGGRTGCFTGDTKVSLVDGRELTLLELVDEYNSGKQNYVYSFNETTKKIEPKLIEKAWCTRKNAELVEVTLDSGEVIRCTPNHRFMLRDSSYCEAQDLKSNDSLMPLYRKYPNINNDMDGYRLYYEPIEDAWHYEHRQFATEVIDEKYLVHHKNCRKYDNTPANLVWCSKAKHQQIHYEMNTGAQSVEANKKRSDTVRQWHKDNKNTESYKERSRKLSEAVLNKLPPGYHDEVVKRKEQAQQNGALIRENAEKHKQTIIEYHHAIEEMFNVNWNDLSTNERNSYAVKYQRACNPETQEAISKKISENHQLGKYINAKVALQQENDLSKKLKELVPTVDKEKFFAIFGFEFDTLIPSKRPPYIVKYRKIVGKEILNHRVVSVKFLNETEDVYDLTIADNHNFALSSGVFVHNSKDQCDAVCGSIWNASQHGDEFAFEYGEELDAAIWASSGSVSESQIKKQITLDFEEELKRVVNDPVAEFGVNQTKLDEQQFMDFGMGRAKRLDASYLPQGIIVF